MSITVQPPRVTSPRELLVDDLKRLLRVESTLAKTILPKLISEVGDELKSALEQHLDETRTHVDNVKKSLQALGALSKLETIAERLAKNA